MRSCDFPPTRVDSDIKIYIRKGAQPLRDAIKVPAFLSEVLVKNLIDLTHI